VNTARGLASTLATGLLLVLPAVCLAQADSYSARTNERLRLGMLEKLEFTLAATAFGGAVGFLYGMSDVPDGADGEARAPERIAVSGSLLYAAAAVTYLGLASPDRGDLPLVMSIAGYVPVTALFGLVLLDPEANEGNIGPPVAASALLSLPAAVLAARWLDLDPGDAALVRDAGFWGLMMGTIGTRGFGASAFRDSHGFAHDRSPSSRAISITALAGMYGGLALGAVGAGWAEVSLERVRVCTWSGYAGAALGAVLMLSSDYKRTVYRGATVGALVGLTTAYVLTGGLDTIPSGTRMVERVTPATFTPLVTTISSAEGEVRPAFGLAGALP